ncbi:MAG: PASTA domain-containing protein [Clostridium sp.]|nr:PASTA domain-containing protein [Clostridium sp.]
MSANKQNKGSFGLRLKDFYFRHPILSNLVFIALAGLLVVWGGLIFLDSWTRHGDTAVVPSVKNMRYDDAVAKLQSQGFIAEISDSVYDPSAAPGTVLESWPRSSATVKPGREVFLTITSFQPRKVRISMPLRDVSSRQAMSYLESIGIKNIRLVDVPSEYPDLVLGAKYDGKSLEPGTLVPITALVTLEVGVVPTVTSVDVDSLDAAIDAAIMELEPTEDASADANSDFYD